MSKDEEDKIHSSNEVNDVYEAMMDYSESFPRRLWGDKYYEDSSVDKKSRKDVFENELEKDLVHAFRAKAQQLVSALENEHGKKL